MTDVWKLTVACTRDEAMKFAMATEISPDVTLTVSQLDDRDDERWQLEGYFESRPERTQIDAALGFVRTAQTSDVKIERIFDEDWVTLSQQSLPPIHVGRFYVHTKSFAHTIPPSSIALLIEAGQAFGTGSHYTTHGCLWMLNQLGKGQRFSNILDIGTGSGILAFAAHRLWPTAKVTASDIDAVAVDVAQHNARVNFCPLGERVGRLHLVCAPGLHHHSLRQRKPYDLLVANILAGPLIHMAKDIAGSMGSGGTLVLAGLLAYQATTVSRAYEARGFRRVSSHLEGDWPTLCLRKI